MTEMVSANIIMYQVVCSPIIRYKMTINILTYRRTYIHISKLIKSPNESKSVASGRKAGLWNYKDLNSAMT